MAEPVADRKMDRAAPSPVKSFGSTVMIFNACFVGVQLNTIKQDNEIM
jgi:hypothetical protein